jgi:ectoine utilization protein EutC
VLLLTEAELRRAVGMEQVVEAVEEAFAALARGEARLPGVLHLEVPEAEGEVHVKGAHLRGAPSFVCKVASGFYRNPERGLPVGSGLVMVFDASTGFPRALLLDNGYLTDLRTGAAGAVAARYLARPELTKVALVGAGVAARYQLRALRLVRAVPEVHVWSRTSERAEGFAREIEEELGLRVRPVHDLEAAVRDADLVVTATPAREPLIRADWLVPGVHVTALGSDGPEKQELDVEVLARADVVIADHLAECLRRGELHHAVRDGAIREDDVAGELGDVIMGRVSGRTDPDQITVADLTGVGVQDAAAGTLALERALAMGLGSDIPSADEGGAAT